RQREGCAAEVKEGHEPDIGRAGPAVRRRSRERDQRGGRYQEGRRVAHEAMHQLDDSPWFRHRFPPQACRRQVTLPLAAVHCARAPLPRPRLRCFLSCAPLGAPILTAWSHCMSARHPALVALALLSATSSLAAQVPAPELQIAGAVSAAPEGMRADATVLGYRNYHRLDVLREGTNGMICVADDPSEARWHVACYHKDLDPFMRRGRELEAAG